MISLTNANALTAASLASFAAGELHMSGLKGSEQDIREAAADAVAPLLSAAALALELSGLTAQEASAGVRDVIVDYISAPGAAPPAHVGTAGAIQ